MKTIRTTRGIKGLTMLGLGMALACPLGSRAQAQPDPNNAAKAENPPNRPRRARGQKGQQGARALARMQERELATAEEVAGKPLTEEQKQKVRDALAAREAATKAAREKYIVDMAASLGMEPDALRLKMREANAKRNGNGGNGAGRRGGRRNRGGAGGAADEAAAPAAAAGG